MPQYDVSRIRGSKHDMYNAAKPDDSLSRGQLLRELFGDAERGDVYLLSPVEFNVGKAQFTFPSVYIRGHLPEQTRLISEAYGDRAGNSFCLQNTSLVNVSLINQADKRNPELGDQDTYEPTEDHRCLGFDRFGEVEGPAFRATLNNVLVYADDWAVYNWSNRGHRLTMLNCQIYSGRVGIAAMGSGGGTSQYFMLERCYIDIHSDRSHSIGHTSNPSHGGTFGAIVRGGLCRFDNCHFRVVNRAMPALPRMACITDTFELNAAANDATNMTITNSHLGMNGTGGLYFDLRNPKAHYLNPPYSLIQYRISDEDALDSTPIMH